MNESDFHIEVERDHLVIILIKKRFLRAIDLRMRDLVSDVKIISAEKEKISLMLIIFEISILNKWVQKNNLNNNLLLATIEFEYLNDEKIFDWLKHFNFHSQKTQIKAHKLLIMNNYEFHLIYEFLQYIDFHNIMIFTLFLHSTHITQSLNVRIFQLMKHYHSKMMNETIQLESISFNKQNFLAFFISLRVKIFIELNIWSTFKQIELVSYSLKMMLKKMRIWQLFESISSQDSFLFFSFIKITLHEFKEIQKLDTELQDDLNDYNILKKLREKFDQYIKKSLVKVSLLALIEWNIEVTHNHSKAKTKRDKLNEFIAQKKRVIIVQQTRDKIIAEVKKKWKKWVRALKQEKKRNANAWIKWNKVIAKDFKLTDKSAQKWINNWVAVLDVKYENETSVEKIVNLLK